MADVVIRPTLKFIKAGYAAVLALTAGAFLGWLSLDRQPTWIPAVVLVLLFWPLSRHVRSRTSKVTITGDKLRYESGVLGKSTRTIQLSKIQDVRVDQSLSQRVFSVGNVSIETAGESSRFTLENIDGPQQVADLILARSQGEAAQGQHG